MAALPRELIKWLQSLDLSLPVKNAKRDFSNGYIVAEILSRYWSEVSLHSFDNGSALLCKADNWAQIEKHCKRHECFLTRELIDGVIHQKNGAAMPMIAMIYNHLTGRTLQVTQAAARPEVPAYALPTAGQLLREAHPTPDNVEKQITRNTEQVKQHNLAILQQHEDALRRVKTTNPDRFKPKPKQNVDKPKFASKQQGKTELHEITVKNGSMTLRSRIADQDLQPEPTPPPEGPDGIVVFLSEVCEQCFNNSGVLFEDDAQAMVGTNAPDARPDYVSKYLANIHKLPKDVKDTVWEALQNSVPELVPIICTRATEFAAFVSCFQSVFDTLLPTSEVWVQVEQLYTLFGQALVSQAPYLSLTVFLTLFMPRYRDHFLAHRPNAEKYHSFLRMFHAFTNHDNTSFRLAVFRSLQDFLSTNDAGTPSEVMLQDPIQKSVPAVNPLRLSSNTAPFLLALAFLVDLETALPEEVVDLYLYYAIVGVGMPSTVARAASLRVFGRLVAMDCATQVLKQLPKLKIKAETAHGDWWEVDVQLLILCSDLMEQVQDPSPASAPTSQPEWRVLGVDGAADDSEAKVDYKVEAPEAPVPSDKSMLYDTIKSCFHPAQSVPCRKIGLSVFARHVQVQAADFITSSNEDPHKQFLVNYMEVLLSLPTTLRSRFLDAEQTTPEVVPGAVCAYEVSSIIGAWQPLAAAQGLCGFIHRKRKTKGALAMADLRTVLEVFALGVLTKRFVDETNRSEWMMVLEVIGEDMHKALQHPSLLDDALQELIVNVITKFHLEVMTPEMPLHRSLEVIQTAALEWFSKWPNLSNA